MPTSSEVTAGLYGTATQVNAIRTDAITRTRIYKFEVNGVITTGDEQGGRFLIGNATETVVAIKHKIKSGTSATFRVQKDTTDVDNSVAASTTAAEETSFEDAALVENQVLTLDITGVSGSPEDLIVQVITTYVVE